MGEHTKGPWRVIRSDSINPETEGPYYHAILDENGKYLASTWAAAHLPNARLMALAPEMLDSLKECGNYLTDAGAPKDILTKIDALVAKATGGGE